MQYRSKERRIWSLCQTIPLPFEIVHTGWPLTFEEVWLPIDIDEDRNKIRRGAGITQESWQRANI